VLLVEPTFETETSVGAGRRRTVVLLVVIAREKTHILLNYNIAE